MTPNEKGQNIREHFRWRVRGKFAHLGGYGFIYCSKAISRSQRQQNDESNICWIYSTNLYEMCFYDEYKFTTLSSFSNRLSVILS
jgi:hypothetical protein